MTSPVLIIAGASASGKTTVAHKLLEIDPQFELIRSATTRPKRNDSFDEEYIYVSDDEFKAMISGGEVIEHTFYSGYYYGTPMSEIQRVFASNKVPLLVLDINGIKSILEGEEVAGCAIYIYEDLNVLEERLYERYLSKEPSAKGLSSFMVRKEQNIKDFTVLPENVNCFYSFVKNDDLSLTVDKIRTFFASFCNGCTKNDSQNTLTAEALRSQALSKIQE